MEGTHQFLEAVKDLKQRGSVADYVLRFEAILFEIQDVPERLLVYHFIAGLNDCLRCRLQFAVPQPDDYFEAIALAHEHEQILLEKQSQNVDPKFSEFGSRLRFQHRNNDIVDQRHDLQQIQETHTKESTKILESSETNQGSQILDSNKQEWQPMAAIAFSEARSMKGLATTNDFHQTQEDKLDFQDQEESHAFDNVAEDMQQPCLMTAEALSREERGAAPPSTSEPMDADTTTPTTMALLATMIPPPSTTQALCTVNHTEVEIATTTHGKEYQRALSEGPWSMAHEQPPIDGEQQKEVAPFIFIAMHTSMVSILGTTEPSSTMVILAVVSPEAPASSDGPCVMAGGRLLALMLASIIFGGSPIMQRKQTRLCSALLGQAKASREKLFLSMGQAHLSMREWNSLLETTIFGCMRHVQLSGCRALGLNRFRYLHSKQWDPGGNYL